MAVDVNYLSTEVNVIWFVIIIALPFLFFWTRVNSKKIQSLTNQLDELKGKTVVHEATLEVNKRRKK